MITFSIIGFAIIIGIIVMDRGHELDYVLRILEKRLKPLGILVDITHHHDETVTITANKRIGLNIQHVTINGNNIIDVMWKLIKYIEREIELWIEKEFYK